MKRHTQPLAGAVSGQRTQQVPTTPHLPWPPGTTEISPGLYTDLLTHGSRGVLGHAPQQLPWSPALVQPSPWKNGFTHLVLPLGFHAPLQTQPVGSLFLLTEQTRYSIKLLWFGKASRWVRLDAHSTSGNVFKSYEMGLTMFHVLRNWLSDLKAADSVTENISNLFSWPGAFDTDYSFNSSAEALVCALRSCRDDVNRTFGHVCFCFPTETKGTSRNLGGNEKVFWSKTTN